jgi:hypothetical protein
MFTSEELKTQLPRLVAFTLPPIKVTKFEPSDLSQSRQRNLSPFGKVSESDFEGSYIFGLPRNCGKIGVVAKAICLPYLRSASASL